MLYDPSQKAGVMTIKTGVELYNQFNTLLGQRFFETGRKKGINFSSGNPYFSPFEPAMTAAYDALASHRMNIYSNPAGNPKVRESVLPFCKQLSLSPKETELSSKNIILGAGITHMHSCIMDMIARDQANDNKKPVILMTAPTYGLFSIQPEAYGIEVDTVPIFEKDSWITNPKILDAKIREINSTSDKKVKAFYRINPHNPTGQVEGSEVTKAVSNVLRKNKVMGVDDMAYWGQEYKDAAVPLAQYDFDNSITMFSLSKTFCAPNLRAGFLCASEETVNKISLGVLSTLQAVPLTAEMAVQASFGNDNVEERTAYIQKNNERYYEKFQLLRLLINGRNGAHDMPESKVGEYIELIKTTVGNKIIVDDILENGVPSVTILNEDLMSGYFAVLRFNEVGSIYYGQEKVVNAFQMAAACVDQGRVLTLPLRSSLAEEQLKDCVRVTVSMRDEKLIKGVVGIYKTLQTLTYSPNESLQADLESKGRALTPDFL